MRLTSAAAYGAVFAAGVALFAARTWWYTGAFSLLYGTSLKNNDTGLRISTVLSAAPWQKVAHSLSALVWMNEPPRPDPRALLVAGGVAGGGCRAVSGAAPPRDPRCRGRRHCRRDAELVSGAHTRLSRTHVDSPDSVRGERRRDRGGADPPSGRRAAAPHESTPPCLRCAVLLGAIAAISPAPDRVTDRDVYEATATHGVVPDCGDLQCFRVLVPWILGPLPGASTLKWKAYAVVCNAATAVAVFAWCLTLGLSRRAAWMGSVASAFGFGSLYTLHDPYTSDPLMYVLGPFIANEALVGRIGVAAAAAAVGVLAKEFAAAPLYIVSAYHAVERQWASALRALAGANVAFFTWLLLTLTLMLRVQLLVLGKRIDRSRPRRESGGMALATEHAWRHLGHVRRVRRAVAADAGRLLPRAAPAAAAGRGLAAVAALFAYVQQPDRALWNFHFLAAPLAATVLDGAPATLAGATLAAFVVANLRVGAQLPIAFVGRTALAASVLLAAASAWTALRAVRS